MPEKKCKHCAMMIPKEAKYCPYCRKRQGLSAKISILILVIAGIFIIRGMMETEKQKNNDRVNLKTFMYKCLDMYPNDKYYICVKPALDRKFKFDDVEMTLKQYIAEHPKK